MFYDLSPSETQSDSEVESEVPRRYCTICRANCSVCQSRPVAGFCYSLNCACDVRARYGEGLNKDPTTSLWGVTRIFFISRGVSPPSLDRVLPPVAEIRRINCDIQTISEGLGVQTLSLTEPQLFFFPVMGGMAPYIASRFPQVIDCKLSLACHRFLRPFLLDVYYASILWICLVPLLPREAYGGPPKNICRFTHISYPGICLLQTNVSQFLILHGKFPSIGLPWCWLLKVWALPCHDSAARSAAGIFLIPVGTRLFHFAILPRLSLERRPDPNRY